MKLLTLIISSLVLFSLAGCGDSGAKAEAPAVKEEQPKKQQISPKAKAVIDEIDQASENLGQKAADVQENCC